jgi:hypothetical protein
MALTDEQKRRVYLYLDVTQAGALGASVGVIVNLATQRLEVALESLTANGETTIVALLVVLDALYLKLQSADTRFQASKVGPIELNPKEWQDRITQWRFFLAKLDAVLFPEGDGILGGSTLQGPFAEP